MSAAHDPRFIISDVHNCATHALRNVVRVREVLDDLAEDADQVSDEEYRAASIAAHRAIFDLTAIVDSTKAEAKALAAARTKGVE